MRKKHETPLPQIPPLAFQTETETQEHQTQETRQTTMTNLYFLSLMVTNLVVNHVQHYAVPAIVAPDEWFDNYYAEQRKHGSGVLMVNSNWIARVVVDGNTNDFTLHSRQVGQQGVTWYDRTVREWATNEWQESAQTFFVTNNCAFGYITNIAVTNLWIQTNFILPWAK